MKPWIYSFVVLFACGGGSGAGGGEDIDLDAQCALSGEQYDAFYDAGGPSCSDPNSESEGLECFQGDSCSAAATCTFVASTQSAQDVSCGLQAVSYDAFYDAGGPYCSDPNSESEGLECFVGDICSGPAQCSASLSAGGNSPTELYGRAYDAFYDAGGPYCSDPNSESEGLECFAGDICSGPAQCKFALASKGGSVDSSKFGQNYDAFYDAGGTYCSDPNSESEGLECFAGDICSGPAQCEIVASARN